MEKTRKVYYFFVVLSIILGVLLLVVLYRTHRGFEYPSQVDFYSSLLAIKNILLVLVFFTISLSIVLKCIISDVESKFGEILYKINKTEDNK